MVFQGYYPGVLPIWHGKDQPGAVRYRKPLSVDGLAGPLRTAKNNINRSLRQARAEAQRPVQPEAPSQLVKSVYLDYFPPGFLIFDQFEELFIFERRRSNNNSSGISPSCWKLPCRKIIIVMREEYLAHLFDFETRAENKKAPVEPWACRMPSRLSSDRAKTGHRHCRPGNGG